MRTGRNPNFRKPYDYRIKQVVFVVVTHLPDEDETGYHKDRFEVIQTCLTTMRERSHCDHSFLIWDNGSGSRLRRWLQEDFRPDILIQSPNMGKGIARAFAVRMFSSDTIVCYSDDDIYYYDNWLLHQLKLLRVFPNVAVVSGYPVRTQFQRGIENTIAWAKKNAKLETGLFIPDEWEKDHAASVGRSWAKYQKLTENDKDYRISYWGLQAYAMSHHCQFIGLAGNIVKVAYVAIDGLLTPDEWPFDVALDEIGLRLCTIERLCRHIGNVLDESFDV